MSKLNLYCLSLFNDDYKKIKDLGYIPVGLGTNKFDSKWLRDNTGNNISKKNKFYGEYTFHYWLWKNKLKEINEKEWIGFCAYRRFWLNQKNIDDRIINFQDKILTQVPKSWNDYEVILGDKIFVNNIKFSKIIKYGKIALLKYPRAILKKNRNIKFHFDMFHGNGVLDKAINVLNKDDKEDFRYYVNNNNSFNQANMFICKSPQLLMRYYDCIFEWLFNCEKIFGFNLKGYGQIRLYAFLAERFLPFWFKKYSKCLEWPIIFNDLRKENFK